MTSTKVMTCMLTLLGILIGGAMAGAGEASCDLDKIPYMKEFNLTLASGPWFSKYASHAPSYWADAVSIKADMQPPEGGVFHTVVTQIETTGTCIKVNVANTVDPDNAALAFATYYDGTVRKVHYLAADYTSTLAVYWDAYRGEEQVPEMSFVSIMTREPNMEVNHAAIDKALEKFCGKGATDLEQFFDRFYQNPDAVCENPIYVNPAY